MKRLSLAKIFVFSSVLVLHWALQFVAWSYADSPLVCSALARVPFYILATPILLISGLVSNEYFWIPATANSVLWSTITTYIVARFALSGANP